MNYRTSPYSIESNNLKQNRLNENPSSINNNLDENENSIRANTNNNNNEQNIQKKDQQIIIQFNCCSTPYFKFGQTLFFYCPNSLKNLNISNQYYSSTVNLSEMPDPPFSLGPECKFCFLFYFSFLLNINR